MARPKKYPSGFTLVELLVVIAIITVLISILLPALTKSRSSSLRISCASNQRQIYMAVMMYANDNRGMMPEVVWNNSSTLYSQPGYQTSSIRQEQDPARYPLYSTTNGLWWGMGKLIEDKYLTAGNVLVCPDRQIGSDSWNQVVQQTQAVIAGNSTAIENSIAGSMYVYSSHAFYAIPDPNDPLGNPSQGKMGYPGCSGGSAQSPQLPGGGVTNIKILITCDGNNLGNGGTPWPFWIPQAVIGHNGTGCNCTYIDGSVQWVPISPAIWNDFRIVESGYGYFLGGTYDGLNWNAPLSGIWPYASSLQR